MRQAQGISFLSQKAVIKKPANYPLEKLLSLTGTFKQLVNIITYFLKM